MNGALVDTHAFVWALTDPDRLGPDARPLIEDPSIELWVSAATAWELATKVRLGKFPAAQPLVAQFVGLVDRLGARELAISSAHALRAGGLEWTERDPFDRMLAAQAVIEHVPLVTRDRSFGRVAGLDARW